MVPNDSILILGAGQAAIQLAHSLRVKKSTASITMVGEETYPPYQRPPLSKGFLKGDFKEERLFLKPDHFYEQKNVNLVMGVTAETIDRRGKQVICSDGISRSYSKLVIATGTRPRPIDEISDARNVLMMRSIEDAKRLKTMVKDVRHITLIGGGYVGLEAAAVIRKMGVEVVVLERMPRLLARVTSDIVSDYFKSLHEMNGVKLCFGTDIEKFVCHGGIIKEVHLKDSRHFKTDLVLVGIGVLPNQEIAQNADITCDNGIMVDADGRTNDPDIFAIGDCSCRPVEGQLRNIRLESVPNAIEQAEIVAAKIAGKTRPAYDPPWFWSDQYDTKIQTVGLFSSYTDVIVRGDISAGAFAVFYFENEKFIAVDAVNDPQSFMAGKQILKIGITLTRERLANHDQSMMDILKSLKKEQLAGMK